MTIDPVRRDCAFKRELRDLAWVPRWGILRVNRRQSVAEHTFFVVAYADQIADFIGWSGDRGLLLRLAWRHDLSECFMSDLPGPSKRAVIDPQKYADFVSDNMKRRFGFEEPSVENAPQECLAIIKVADLIDECLYLAGEVQSGNRAAEPVLIHNSRPRLDAAIWNLPGAHNEELMRALHDSIVLESQGSSQVVMG